MRTGNFTSSNVWKLMTNDRTKTNFGASGLKYIKQKKYERLLDRSINPERESRPTSWGRFVEKRAFDLLPQSYQLVSEKRLVHPKYEFWTGAPDLITEKSVGDAKCPFSLEVFCDKIAALSLIEKHSDLTVYKDDFPEDYWQHVSNSILTGKNFAEAIIYCPYESELKEIRNMADNYTGDQNKIAWINWAYDIELPYLKDGGTYKNLNIFQFEIPESDKIALASRVLMANEMIKK